jgi:opacity protein-like surface antigen
MKMKYTQLALTAAMALLGALSIGTKAQAAGEGGLYVEPGLTYQQSNHQVEYPVVNNSSGTSNGFGLVGRLGFHVNEMFFVAADARYGIPHFKDSSVNYDASSTAWQIGPVAGVQMPNLGLRAWVGYVAAGVLDPAASGNLDVKFHDLQGYNVGVGFHVQMISLNLEYQHSKYNKMEGTGTAGPFSSTTDFSSVHLNQDAVIASVTFPIEL